MCTSSSSLSLAAKQDVFPYVFPHPGLEVADGLSSRVCAILPKRIAPTLGPGLCLLSSISPPRILVQLGDTLTHLAAASLCPEGCSELVSLPSLRGWCDYGVNVLCCTSLLPSLGQPPLSFPFCHIPMGVCPFPSHALMQGLLCPGTLGGEAAAAELQSHPVPMQVLPTLHTLSMAAGSAPLLCALSWVPLPSAPSQQPSCHQDITSEEKWCSLTFPALAASQEFGPTMHRVLAGDEGYSLPQHILGVRT